jgi:hypothetical protein
LPADRVWAIAVVAVETAKALEGTAFSGQWIASNACLVRRVSDAPVETSAGGTWIVAVGTCKVAGSCEFVRSKTFDTLTRGKIGR